MARPEGLWAITAYFNPMQYRRRLFNFRIFRKHLRIPLVAVELAYAQEFDLHEKDADILVQLRGGALLWQKERLLNIALSALPSSCRKVAWLDCDIMLSDPGWADSVNSLLDRFPMVQLFSQVHYLSRDWSIGANPAKHVELTRPSAVSSLASGIPAAECVGHLMSDRVGTSANGLAWAARYDLLKQHGFFDGCIVGGGDRAMICASKRCFEELMIRHYMNEQGRKRYLEWAIPFSQAMGADLGYVQGDIFHLWHGDLRRRALRNRHEGLRVFQFDPFNDIKKDGEGPWQWNSNKPEMHNYVATYFTSRKEDG